jgi:hypothetical protein
VSRRAVVGGSAILVGICALILFGVFGPLRHPTIAPAVVSRPIGAPIRVMPLGNATLQYGGVVAMEEPRTGRILAAASLPSTAP